MANTYQFSPSSVELVERCINAASQPATKWNELFNTDNEEPVFKEENISSSADTVVLSQANIENGIETEEQVSNTELEQVERIRATLEAQTKNKLEFLIDQCTDNLLSILADKLSPHCLEAICGELLNNSVNQYEKILLSLFPVYIKQENSSTALNLLVKANNSYPDSMISLIETLFISTDIPNNLLEQFLIAADVKIRTQFIQAISIKDIPVEVFIHHLNTINYLYKNCQKLSMAQSFVLNGLLKSSPMCQENKNYGLCMLTFFQGLNENDVRINRLHLVTLLDNHKTSFKIPCKSILDKLYQNQD